MLKGELILYIRSFADLFLPRRCIVCGDVLFVREEHICTCCRADIPYTYYWNRPHNPMADRFNEMIQRNLPDEGPREPYAFACALFFYRSSGAFREITRELKYRRNIREGRFFARELARKIRSANHFQDVDAAVPVPLHPSRLRERGYNQAEIITQELSGILGIQCLPDLLERVRRTATQTHLDSLQRENNVSSAFRIKQMPGRRIRHILIVDDVFTTGATVNACYRALRKALGPEVRISAVTLGCVVME